MGNLNFAFEHKKNHPLYFTSKKNAVAGGSYSFGFLKLYQELIHRITLRNKTLFRCFHLFRFIKCYSLTILLISKTMQISILRMGYFGQMMG